MEAGYETRPITCEALYGKSAVMGGSKSRTKQEVMGLGQLHVRLFYKEWCYVEACYGI
jgi:hypothetical protein